jgi:ribosome-binding protein aMBF1 (putative translation factor)
MRKSMTGARPRACFSQRELARWMTVSPSAIARIERGATLPNVRLRRQAAEATGSKRLIRLEGPELPGTPSVGRWARCPLWLGKSGDLIVVA